MFLEYFNNKLSSTTKLAKYNIIALGVIGTFGHPLYWAIWTYIFPQPYENVFIRFSAAIACLVLLLNEYLPERTKRYFPAYWFCAVIYALPFLFTVHLIKNNFSDIWMMCEVGMGFMVIIFIPDALLMLLNIILGVVLAIWFCNIFPEPSSVVLENGVRFFPGDKYIPIWTFLLVAGPVFSNSGILGATYERANKVLRYSLAIAGSIAHELRNPINTINLTGTQIKNLLNQSSDFNNKEKISSLTDQISDSISEANNIINIILSDLSENPIDDKDFVFLQPNLIIPKIVQNYSYKNQDEKNCVQIIVSPSNDFTIKAVAERFTFIIYNLLKNALYYLNQYTDLKITIGAEVREIKGVKWNTIYVHDTGPGISPEIISKLFDDFYTNNKKDGTGLGLSFCKRNMKAFGGDIICESQFGNGANGQRENGWTKFSLLFPQVSKDNTNITSLREEQRRGNPVFELDSESPRYARDDNSKNPNNSMTNLNTKNISDFSELLANKKILIADDHDLSLKTMQGWLECYGCEVSTALNGEELVRAYKNNLDQNYKSNFDLIITDFCMPIKNGDEVVREIRELEKQNNVSSCNATPIIVVSGNDDRETLNQLLEPRLTNYFIKGSDLNHLLEIVCKSVL